MHNARRILMIALLGTALAGAAWADGSFSLGVGGNFFLNGSPYLDAVSANYSHVLQETLELSFGADLALNVANQDSEGQPLPSFLVPITLGLDFAFPGEVVTFLFGTGVSPILNFNPGTEDEFRFYIGPFLQTELRIRVHPIMSIFVSAQQDLPIGRPNWINTSTRLLTGINFAFGASK